jgi:signal recognition particle GTPase
MEKTVAQSSSKTAEPEKVELETPIKEEMSPNVENANNRKAADIVQETPDEKQELESDEDVIPKPKEVKKKKSSFVVKEEVSSEEEKKNNELLQELRILYKSTIQYMTEMCNSQYRIIINKMQEAVDTNVFKQQFTKMYLDLSDDTSSELYKKLYEVDINTQKFHKEIVHQIKHLGCFNCGTEWDEDITFLEKGPHMVRCPKCYNSYPFEK